MKASRRAGLGAGEEGRREEREDAMAAGSLPP